MEIDTERLRIRLAREDEAPLVVDYFARNREHLARWEPEPPPGFYDVGFWRERLAGYAAESVADRGHRVHLFEPDGRRIVGTVGVSNLVRGCFQSANLGFGVCASREGEGLMREACEAVITHAFDVLHLHRLEANHRPENVRSAALLRRLGFVPFGYARDYLHIAGRWVDHVTTQRINVSWTPPLPPDPPAPRT